MRGGILRPGRGRRSSEPRSSGFSAAPIPGEHAHPPPADYGELPVNSNSRAWQDLIAAWRGDDWTGCAGILRPIVEELPEVLSTRLLLAGFAARARNPGLALLHYEKLMVQAVGQGELFHALAAERGLDSLRHDENAHRKRVQALQQWFKTMPQRSRGRKNAALPRSWIVDLPPGDFRRYAESSRLLLLPPRPHGLGEATDVFAVVLQGSVKWSYVPDGEAPLPPVSAASGDVIAGPPSCTPQDHIQVEAEEPGVLLEFHGEIAALLRDRMAAERRAAATSRSAFGEISAPRIQTPPSAEPEVETSDRLARPPLDPVLEPLRSGGPAGHDRRREHEMIVRFEAGEADLGLAGTRTTAITGRIVELSPAGLTIALPRATVRQSRSALEGAHVVTQVSLPGDDEPLRLAGRVTSLAFEPPSIQGSPRAHLAIEFVLLLAQDRARLQEAMIEATRNGHLPWAASAAFRAAA